MDISDDEHEGDKSSEEIKKKSEMNEILIRKTLEIISNDLINSLKSDVERVNILDYILH